MCIIIITLLLSLLLLTIHLFHVVCLAESIRNNAMFTICSPHTLINTKLLIIIIIQNISSQHQYHNIGLIHLWFLSQHWLAPGKSCSEPSSPQQVHLETRVTPASVTSGWCGQQQRRGWFIQSPLYNAIDLKSIRFQLACVRLTGADKNIHSQLSTPQHHLFRQHYSRYTSW